MENKLCLMFDNLSNVTKKIQLTILFDGQNNIYILQIETLTKTRPDDRLKKRTILRKIK